MYPSECVFVLCSCSESFERVIHPQSDLAWVDQPASDEWVSEWDKLSSLIIKKSDFQWQREEVEKLPDICQSLIHYMLAFLEVFTADNADSLSSDPHHVLLNFSTSSITWWRHQLCRISLANSSAMKPCEVVGRKDDERYIDENGEKWQP